MRGRGSKEKGKKNRKKKKKAPIKFRNGSAEYHELEAWDEKVLERWRDQRDKKAKEEKDRGILLTEVWKQRERENSNWNCLLYIAHIPPYYALYPVSQRFPQRTRRYPNKH